MEKFKAGILQFDVGLGCIDDNFRKGCSGILELAEKGAGLVVLPEMWSCGFDNENLEIHAKKTPEILSGLSQIAKENKLVIAGSMPELYGKKVFNTLYLVDTKGEVAEKYRKVHLFSPTNEDDYFARGNRAVACDTHLGKAGLAICYDLRFPELCTALTGRGARFIIVSAQWPAVRTEHWDVLLRARAVENQVFVIACNRCGKDPDLLFAGHSQIVSPWGDVLAKADSGECQIVAEIDLGETEKVRKQIPCLDEKVPEAYE